jgi:hypothetical protein
MEGDGSLRPGFIINSLTKEILPAEFVPVFLGYNWLKFNPRDDKDPKFNPAFAAGALIYRTSDPTDPVVIEEGKFGENGELPTITKFINFLALFVGEKSPILIPFCKTSYKAGKNLISLATFNSDNGKISSHKYRLTSKQQKNDKGTFFVMNVEPAGRSDDESIARADAFYGMYREKPIVMHDEENIASE